MYITTMDSYLVTNQRKMPQLVCKEQHIANTWGYSFIGS